MKVQSGTKNGTKGAGPLAGDAELPESRQIGLRVENRLHEKQERAQSSEQFHSRCLNSLRAMLDAGET